MVGPRASAGRRVHPAGVARWALLVAAVGCAATAVAGCGSSTEDLCAKQLQVYRSIRPDVDVPGDVYRRNMQDLADLAKEYDDPAVVADGARLQDIVSVRRPDLTVSDVLAAQAEITRVCFTR